MSLFEFGIKGRPRDAESPDALRPNQQFSFVSLPSISRQMLREFLFFNSTGNAESGKFWKQTGRTKRLMAKVPTDVNRESVVAG